MNIMIKTNCENSPDIQRQIAEIITDAYWEQISRLCDDKEKMTAAMTGAYNTEYFYIAYDGDIAVGVAACCPPGRRALRINAEHMRRVLGEELGQTAVDIMKSEFEQPLDFGPDSGYIEFVATAVFAQGKGVASAITKCIQENAPYRRLLLEVADTNTAAIRLYEKFSFTEFKRIPEQNSEDNGVNYRIYMEYVKTTVGKMIGQGNTAEIFDYGNDCVLKLYRDAMPEQVCRDEFRYTLIAYQATSKAPEPIEITYADGRIGGVYKKLHGKTMLKLMMTNLLKSGHYARCFADYHIGIQKAINEDIPTVKEKLKRDIENTDMLTENEKQLIYHHLSGLPEGNILCHFDFHPDNIMLHENQYGILDWMTACKGDKLSDVARTGIILKFSQIPRVPAIVNMIIGFAQKSIYRKYIRWYLEKTGAKTGDIEKWELAVAAARLREWIPEREKQKLLQFIKHRIERGI